MEQDKVASNTLKDNLVYFSIINKTKIFNDKVENVLKILKEKFDIFFFDPPFANSDFLQEIKFIKKRELFKKNHIIIIHREKKTEDNFENSIEIIKTKYYGRSKIIFGVFK